VRATRYATINPVPQLPRLTPVLRRARRILFVLSILAAQLFAAADNSPLAYIAGLASCGFCALLFATWWYDKGYDKRHSIARRE